LATTYKPVKSLARGWVSLIDAQPSAARFFEVLDTPLEIQDSPDAIAIDRLSRGIELHDVSFSYGRESVLKNISFEVRAGEVAAIVGPTGSGKTTLVDLLLRFYDPTSGSIEFDGIDLRRVQRNSLYERIAVVTQEPYLFDASIMENIRFGKPGATDDEVLAAARAANVDEFARQFPDRYATETGAGGVRLSGGQRQRITIARAILKDPSILIFDEATSSLDSKSERLVQDAIEALFGSRTVLLIAHRLSTVARADKIIVLENGAVTQIGTHSDLSAKSGLYREWVDLQAHTPAAPR
jgi:ABC-type multidrug transport system fused ATPase/permease subunit